MYYVTFCKHFGEDSWPMATETEWRVFATENKDKAIGLCHKLNELPLLNLQTERFRVWESPTKKWSKKSVLIY